MTAAAEGRSPQPRRLPPWVRAGWRVGSSIVVTLLGLLGLTFFIGRMLPIDPVIAIVGEQAEQSTYDMVYKQLGLDRPLYVQFGYFIRDMMSGNFGQALFTGNRVIDDLRRVFPATIELATFAICIGVFVGVPVGMLAAVYRGRAIDHVARMVGLIGYSSPTFWLGLMGLVIFYAALGWVGGPGRLDVYFIDVVDLVTGSVLIDSAIAGEWDVFRNAFSHIVLPGSILGFASMAYISRMTRSFMLEQLGQEYVIAARVKGLSKWRVIWRHAFRNILVQLITVIALAYAFLLEGAVLTETVFAWPGFGRYLTAGLLAGDMNAVLACTLIIGLIFVGLNLLSDLLYRLLDPRTR
ncbi:MAG: ABC transporter permease [Alphaproteobacteria bacterium]|nr:ABC transporter permease [Alphaproteobacteria bacterium]